MLVDPTISLVSLALDAATLRHQAIANNIANAHTPGYVPLRVSFEERLAGLRESGGSISAAMRDLRPQVEPDRSEIHARNTSVMIDMEMVKLSQNTINYQALARALGKKLSLLATAVNEGRR